MGVTADLFSTRITAVNRERYISSRSLPLMGVAALVGENAWRRVVGLDPLPADPRIMRRLALRNDVALTEVLSRPAVSPTRSNPGSHPSGGM